MKKKTLDVRMIDWFDDHWYRVRFMDERKIEIEDYFASVTTKLGILSKPHLIRWYADLGYQEAKRRMREAADRGTRIHWAWFTYTQGGAVVYQNPRTPAYEKHELDEIFQRFNNNVWVIENQDEHYDFLKLVQMFRLLKPRIVEAEKTVYNVEHREAGTADNILNIEEGEYMISGSKPLTLPGGLYIGDLKTGASVGSEAFQQISAYVHCAESMGYDRFVGALIYHTQGASRSGIEGLKVYFLNRDEIEQHYQDYRDISRVWERQGLGRKPIIRQMPCLVVLEQPKEKEKENDGRTEKEDRRGSAESGGVEEETPGTVSSEHKEEGQVEQTSPGKTVSKNEGAVESKTEKQDKPNAQS
jgi:hypothetical protein